MGCMPSKSSKAPAKVLVLGASGSVGKSTLGALKANSKYSNVDVYAGVRDPSKFQAMEGITAVQTDMGGDKATLTETLKDFDRVFVVTPGAQDRTAIASNALEACKDAGVKFVLLVSVLTADTDSIFGNQFKPLEAKVKEIDVSYSIVRLPLFIDNQMTNAASIKESGTFYDPRDPSKPHTPVAVADIGKAAAAILADPDKHSGQTYNLVSPAFSMNDLADAYSKHLDKKVTVTTVHYNACKESMMGLGFPEWMVNGIIELFRSIDDGKDATNVADTGDIQKITGDKAMTIDDWVKENAAAFK